MKSLSSIYTTGLSLVAGAITGGLIYLNQSSTINNLPEINLPVVSVPSIGTNYQVNVPTVNYYAISNANITTPDIRGLFTCTNKNSATRMKTIGNFEKKKELLFKDSTALRYDTKFNYTNPYCHRWMDIYTKYQSYTNNMIYKQLTYIPKIIAEVKAPQNTEHKIRLYDNINYLKTTYKYNTVLIRFDCTENIERLKEICQYIKYTLGMKIYIAFSPYDNIEQTIFINPDTLKMYLTELASLSDGYLLSYRRLSQHYTSIDIEYTRFMIDTLRKANSEILIFGEIYIGEKYSNNGVFELTSNIPTNSSGAILFNAGVETSDIYSIMKRLDKKSKIIGCVVGSKYYYNSKYKTFEPFYKSMKIKTTIQNRFINNGCIGYMTFISDGSEDSYDLINNLSNNLSEAVITIGE